MEVNACPNQDLGSLVLIFPRILKVTSRDNLISSSPTQVQAALEDLLMVLLL